LAEHLLAFALARELTAPAPRRRASAC
jgi:hypothetical protein